MNKFKIGDKVECINDRGSHEVLFVENTYVIRDLKNSLVYLVGNAGGWKEDRFKLIQTDKMEVGKEYIWNGYKSSSDNAVVKCVGSHDGKCIVFNTKSKKYYAVQGDVDSRNNWKEWREPRITHRYAYVNEDDCASTIFSQESPHRELNVKYTFTDGKLTGTKVI